MRFIQHPSNNYVLGAPAGHDQKVLPVGALPVTMAEIDGCNAIVSYWKPEPEELASLLRGKPVMLMVFSPQHPVVSVGVEP